jgi:M6 family metalloprotease-like protein
MRSAILVALLLWAGGGAAVAVAQAPAQELTGTMHVLWGDPPAGPPVLRYLLAGDDGVSRMVDVEESVLAAAGGLLLVNGSRMRVQLAAAPVPQGRQRARALLPLGTGVAPGMVAESQAATVQAPVRATRPYVTILCRFADSANQLPGTKERYERLMGASYPGVNHYWTEVTEGGITLDGSVVVGWYTLPKPRSAYLLPDNSADLTMLLTDCTAAADRDVDYTRFHGINMQFNTNLDCCSWGGGRVLTLDGVTRFWATTWEASWASVGTYAHEVGHSLGLPHSGGPYGYVYDSRYDVMSNSSWYRDPGSDFAMGSHTIGYHKDRLGAIPAARRVLATAPLTRVALERSALPRAIGGAQLVVIPVAGETGEFYTIESRRGGGYDAPLAQAVVIHYVNPLRSEPAQVVDVDGNGDVNDAGGQWEPHELFRDLRQDITVLIDSVRDEQVHITVLRGERPWLALDDAAHVHRVPYGSMDVIQDSVVLQTSPGLPWQATAVRRRAQLLNPAGAGSALLRWQRVAGGLSPGVYVDTIRVLSPGAVGHLAFAVDSLIVAEPGGTALSVALSATTRADSVFEGATAFLDSAQIRFAGNGAATAAWTVTTRRATTLVHSPLTGAGDGVIRWYHWGNAPPGIYVDTLTLTAPGAAGSPVSIIDTLYVHALPSFTVTRSVSGPAIVAEGSTVRDSVLVTPTNRWATAGTWTASYQGTPSYLRLLDQQRFTGAAVLPFERRAESRAPGLYVDTVRLAATIPMPGVLLIDTMEVRAAPLALRLSWSSRRDSVLAGVTQTMDSVLVLATGPGAYARTWVATVSDPSRITLGRRDAFTQPGRGNGTAFLRWFRNTAGREPGLYVDTITISFADAPLSAVLVDSVTVLHAITARLSAPSRSAFMLAGAGSSRDSVQLALFGAGSAQTAWTAHANGEWLTLDATAGAGSAWLAWTRAAGALPLGIYVDTIRVSVPSAGGAAAYVVDTLRIVEPVAVTSDSLRPPVAVGRAHVDSLRATGGTGTYTWAVVDGAFPAGLALAASGVVSGQAIAPTEQRVTVRATSAGFDATRVLRYVALLPPMTSSDSIRPAALLGQSYADTLHATGGDGAYAWSVASGELPAGLVLAPTGVIAGTPTDAGSTRVVARVTSATLVTDVPLRFTVAGPIVITSPAALRTGRMGAAYADTLRGTGGSGTLAWSVRDGALPAGIALDAATGVLSGVPEEAGEFTGRIGAAVGTFETTASFQLAIVRPVLAESAVIDALLGATPLSGDDARFLDLLGNRNGRLDIGDVRAWLSDAGRLAPATAAELQIIIERRAAALRKDGGR